MKKKTTRKPKAPSQPFINLVAEAVAKEQANGPITVAVPNVSREKMRAICDLAEAIKTLSKTLDSINVSVEVRGNVIANNTLHGANAIGVEWSKGDGYFGGPPTI